MSKLLKEHNSLKMTKTSNNFNNNKITFSNNIRSNSFSKISNNSSTSLNNNMSISLKKKQLFHEKSKKHPKCSSCTNKRENILKKNKSALSNYILMNIIGEKNYYYPNIKLLGNSRYKYSSPLLFVEDQKNNISNSNYGLIPIPLKKFKKKDKNKENDEETKNLYELQRSIVMSRRFQYNKGKNKWKNNEDDFYKKIILIQRWWKDLIKINNNYKIEDLNKKLKNFANKNTFYQLKNLLLKKTILNSICFISKIKYNNLNENIKKIQYNFRTYLKNYRFGKELKIKKNLNVICYITKYFLKYSFQNINESTKKKPNIKNIIYNIDNSINNIKNNLANEQEIKNKYKDIIYENHNKNNNNFKEKKNVNPKNIDMNKNGNLNSIQKNNLINKKETNNNDKNKKTENNIIKQKNYNNKSLINNKNNISINENEKKNINNVNEDIKNNNNNNNINNNKQEKNYIGNYNKLNDFNNSQKGKKNNTNKNIMKIMKFLLLIKKSFYSYLYKKLKNYKNNSIIIMPKIFICYITKDNIIIRKEKENRRYIIKGYNLNDNKIEKLEIEINNNDNFVEKIYKKPIINGRSFKYQYYFSNNPYSYMNVCFISKVILKNNDIYDEIYKYYVNKNCILNEQKNKSKNDIPKKFLKEIKNNDVKDPFNDSYKNGNLENDISLGKINNNSRRNSRISLSHLSERKKKLSKFKINDEDNNNSDIIKIIKNYKDGYFISKKIFIQSKKEIIIIQRNIRKMTLTKNKVFKRASYSYVDNKILTNVENNSNKFDTENVKAKIIVNTNKKKSLREKDSLNLSNDTKNEFEEKRNNINNLEPTNNNSKLLNIYENNNCKITSKSHKENKNQEINNNLEESISDSSIVTKIKLNYETNKDYENDEESNNYIIKETNNSKDIFYITKTRKNNDINNVNKIQNCYKYHLYLMNSKNKFNNTNIFQKPKNKKCYVSIERFIKTNIDRYMFIYNSKTKYFILLLKLFITKNVQDYIFKIIKNKNIDNNKNYFGFPFYIQTIKRVVDYLNTKKNTNKKVFLFFNEIFNYNNNKFKSTLSKLCFLSKKDNLRLINSNIFTGYEENELINFLCDFSEFDKNLNNEEFIIERLKRIKLNNTNIFTLIKLIDVEYENLVKGEYCFKC